MKPRKTLEKILGGSKNIAFEDMRRLVEAFGFRLARVSGSHHIFRRPAIAELVNLQNVAGQAKSYRFVNFSSWSKSII
jgi:predicted RNA binding protein YcfA (HicA-like mRNA interferase family)